MITKQERRQIERAKANAEFAASMSGMYQGWIRDIHHEQALKDNETWDAWNQFDPFDDPKYLEYLDAEQKEREDAGCLVIYPDDPLSEMYGYYPRCRCRVCEG